MLGFWLLRKCLIMARIRTIKPDFWTDEKIVQLPYEARLLFIGMWNFADDYGFIWDEPDRIRLQVLPGDDVDAEVLIDLLMAAGLIERISNEDFSKFAIRICKFSDHQKVDRPTDSRISREVSRKVSIDSSTRRAVAIKYGAKPGETTECSCYYCGMPGKIFWSRTTKGKPGAWVAFSFELDHLEPENKGGETTVNNIVLACRECNRSKGTSSFYDFLSISREFSTNARDGMERNGKEVKPLSTSAKLTYDDVPDFLRFWSAYPRKDDKKKSFIAWNKNKPPIEQVLKAIERITSPEALGMSARRITVSTAGVAKMIQKLGDDQVRFKLALSLHAANDEKRNKIMPINETNNIKVLIDSLNYFYRKTKNEITLEYILFKDLNDGQKDADELVKIYRQVPADLVNIIEYNPIDFFKFEKPEEDAVQKFMQYLGSKNVNAKLRRSRGKDIDAACGQLANKDQ